MTRVNLINPKLLADQHVFAEWRELKMIPRSLRRTLISLRLDPSTTPECGYHKLLLKIPPHFTLNAGHVTFFYDKATYIKQRYDALTQELLKRGFNFDHEAPVDLLNVWLSLPSVFHKDYIPDSAALELITNRINSKIAEKPSWYRYYGGPYPFPTFAS